MKALVDDDIDINAQDDNGWTALHFAAQNNHFKTLELLLKNSANPNLADKQGNGPLWTASMPHANRNHKNCHGRSPLYLANIKHNGLLDIFATYGYSDIKTESLQIKSNS